jgi:hypothetical protein
VSIQRASPSVLAAAPATPPVPHRSPHCRPRPTRTAATAAAFAATLGLAAGLAATGIPPPANLRRAAATRTARPATAPAGPALTPAGMSAVHPQAGPHQHRVHRPPARAAAARRRAGLAWGTATSAGHRSGSATWPRWRTPTGRSSWSSARCQCTTGPNKRAGGTCSTGSESVVTVVIRRPHAARLGARGRVRISQQAGMMVRASHMRIRRRCHGRSAAHAGLGR